MLIYNKDDIQFVTELPCFLGHPVFQDFGLRFTDGNVPKRDKKFWAPKIIFVVENDILTYT